MPWNAYASTPSLGRAEGAISSEDGVVCSLAQFESGCLHACETILCAVCFADGLRVSMSFALGNVDLAPESMSDVENVDGVVET